MFILHDILGKLKNEFVLSRKDDERAEWFIHTLLAIIIPLHRQRPQTSSDAFTTFSGLPTLAENDIIRSWPLPNSPGRPFGEGCGK